MISQNNSLPNNFTLRSFLETISQESQKNIMEKCKECKISNINEYNFNMIVLEKFGEVLKSNIFKDSDYSKSRIHEIATHTFSFNALKQLLLYLKVKTATSSTDLFVWANKFSEVLLKEIEVKENKNNLPNDMLSIPTLVENNENRPKRKDANNEIIQVKKTKISEQNINNENRPAVIDLSDDNTENTNNITVNYNVKKINFNLLKLVKSLNKPNGEETNTNNNNKPN